MDSYRAGAILVVIGVRKSSLYEVVVDDGVLGIFAKAVREELRSQCGDREIQPLHPQAGQAK